MDKTVFYQPAADAPPSLLWREPGHIRLLPLQGRQTVGRRGGDSRKAFFQKIIQAVTGMGGGMADVL